MDSPDHLSWRTEALPRFPSLSVLNCLDFLRVFLCSNEDDDETLSRDFVDDDDDNDEDDDDDDDAPSRDSASGAWFKLE